MNQQVIAEQEVRTNKFGSFAGKFTLPKEVLNGMFIISTDGGSQMITVAEYKRPKFEITFNPLKDAYKLGDQLTVSGIAKTYSGVNIENSKVTYTVQARTFDWGLQENTIATGKTQTNAKENLKFLSKRKNHPIHLQYTEDSKLTQFPSRLQRPTGKLRKHNTRLSSQINVIS